MMNALEVCVVGFVRRGNVYQRYKSKIKTRVYEDDELWGQKKFANVIIKQ
jgi:hypothetical protein